MKTSPAIRSFLARYLAALVIAGAGGAIGTACSSSSGTPAPGATGGQTASGTGGTTAGGSGGQGTASGGSSAGTGGGSTATGGSATNTGGAVATGGTGTNGSGGTAGLGNSASGGSSSTDGGVDAAGGAGTGGRGTGGGGPATDGGAGAGGGTPRKLKAAMVIITSGTPTAGDRVMLGRLTARGIETTTFTDVAVTAAAVAGMDLIVISSSAESGPLGAKLRDVAIPVLCIENGEYPLMGFTPTTLNTDYGMLTPQTQVRITAGGSPLVGSLTGTVTISNVPAELGWGTPGPAALKGAALVTNANRFAIFGYAKGDQMVGLVAPARRAAFAIRETLAANLSPDGIKLFDALLDWVLM